MHVPAKKQKQSDQDDNGIAVLYATAGAVAGAVARFVVGPLDVLKIRFQVQLEPIASHGTAHSKYSSMRQAIKTIAKEEGIQGLWRGTVPGLLLTIPYTAVQFVTLQHCKKVAEENGWDRNNMASFVNGAMAGAAGTVASYPFDILRTTLAAQGEPKVYSGILDASKGIIKQHGPMGLYRGLGVTLLEIVPYAALQFGLYDAFNKQANQYRKDEGLHETNFQTLQAFFCGLISGTIAKLGTHPLDVAKKRFQVAGLQRSASYGQRVSADSVVSLRKCLQVIYAKEGIAGFYKGAMPSVLKAAPSAAVTFACYDFVLRLLLAHSASSSDKSSK